MRIELRDENRTPIGRVHVDPAERPTRVMTENNGVRRSAFGSRRRALSVRSAADRQTPTALAKEVFLTWDTALDDAGQLRRCVACGCADLFREKAFPQVTVIVVILAFIGAVIGTFGLATELPVLLIMIGVLVLDVAILFFSRRRLVCYQCRTTYHDLPIAGYHRDWDRSRADRYPQKTESGKQKTEVRNQRSEVGGQTSGAEDLRSGSGQRPASA